MPQLCAHLLFLMVLSFPFAAEALVSWVISDPKGNIIESHNADTPMVPASILKIPTALYALHHLGKDHVFTLAWSMDHEGNLVISGSGDPVLTSIPLKNMVEDLAKTTERRNFSGLVVDISDFESGLSFVDGALEGSIHTYDAPLSPFGVNFNSIYFKKDGETYLSAEEETPFLPMAEVPAKKSRKSFGRIPMPHQDDYPVRYAAALSRHFLEGAGFSFEKEELFIRREKPLKEDIPLLLSPSPHKLSNVVQMLMRYSNNFLANQLLLASDLGKKSEESLTMDLARNNLENFLRKEIGISAFTFEEASGISRKNSISSKEMLKVTQAFSPYMKLLREEDSCDGWYKTGTLSNVRTRAGFFKGKDGWYTYVLMTEDENDKYDDYLRNIRQKLVGREK